MLLKSNGRIAMASPPTAFDIIDTMRWYVT